MKERRAIAESNSIARPTGGGIETLTPHVEIQSGRE